VNPWDFSPLVVALLVDFFVVFFAVAVLLLADFFVVFFAVI
jgi:hypothetical protein